MKIVITKQEYKDFAIKSLRNKYSNLLPMDTDLEITEKYDGTVEIDFIERPAKSALIEKEGD